MDEAIFQRNFPPGENIPVLLRALLAFQNQARSWYSGHFEIDRWEYGRAAWFGDKATSEQFIVFGHGPDGSLYTLWAYPGRTIENSPVVFLGSEGTDCGLISGDLRQFLSLLALGADELGFEISWGEVQQAQPPASRLAEFRDWLKSNFGIEQPLDPLGMVKECRSQHPDFEAWLTAWQASRA
jgi:hypothetical protein